jgi:hypothetical protein
MPPTQDWSAYYQQMYGADPSAAPQMTEEQQKTYWNQVMSDPAYAGELSSAPQPNRVLNSLLSLNRIL